MIATAHYTTTNTAHAACLRALGFRVSVRNTEAMRSGHRSHSYAVEVATLDGAGNVLIDLPTLMQTWKGGGLVKIDPLHPWLCGLRALHNYKALLAWLKDGTSQRLVTVSQRHATQYVSGTTLLSDYAAQPVQMRTNDLRLAAALGTIGLPVVKIEGSDQRRALFVIPVQCYELVLPINNLAGRYDARELVARVSEGSHELILEQANPTHPLAYAMRALRCYRELMEILSGKPTQLLMQHGEKWQQTGLLPGNPSGRMMDKAAAAIGIPTSRL